MENIKELTRAELDVMQVLWSRENQFLADIIASMPEPRPAYTTVSTVIRTLVKKGFVTFTAYNKSFCYNPAITKEEYTSSVMQRVKMNFFEGSIAQMISYFAKKESLTAEERRELLEMIDEK